MVRAAGLEPAHAFQPNGFSYHFDFRRRLIWHSWSGLADAQRSSVAKNRVPTHRRPLLWFGVNMCELRIAAIVANTRALESCS